jgi:hypothetical protein
MWGRNHNRELTLEEKIAIQKLKDMNVSYFEISYSGGGDDGCIDDLQCYDHKEEILNIANRNNILQVLDEYFYNLLSENIEWDWVNNDGGWGLLRVDLETGESTIDHTQRVSEDHSYDLDESNKLVELLSGSS